MYLKMNNRQTVTMEIYQKKKIHFSRSKCLFIKFPAISIVFLGIHTIRADISKLQCLSTTGQNIQNIICREITIVILNCKWSPEGSLRYSCQSKTYWPFVWIPFTFTLTISFLNHLLLSALFSKMATMQNRC